MTSIVSRRLFLLLSLAVAGQLVTLPALADDAEKAPRTGEVTFTPVEDEATAVPEPFQLEEHKFPFEQKFLKTSSKAIEISEVTFPSPVETPHANNNTVHAEYFKPLSEGKHPAVIVLHILGGDFDLSRLVARQLASNGVAALFIKLPYYGPRSEPGVEIAMVDPDPHQTVKGFTQAVLDIRRGAAWLAAQEEVDPEQLGITGISLGGITTSLAAAGEPRFKKVCPILAGGDIARVSTSSPEAAVFRERWQEQGGTMEELVEILKPIDPVTHADRVKGRKILMLNARYDEVVPPECSESLWEAFGQPEIHWYDSGHYSFARFIFDALSRATRFFQPDGSNSTTAAASSN